MGLIFVLLFWAMFLCLLGIPAAIVLYNWSSRNQKRLPNNYGKSRPLFAAFLPYVLIAFGGTVFIVYCLWCLSVRHIDPGIGDGWEIPIGNNFYFCMIDIPDNGYILQGGCTGSADVYDITDLAAVGDRIVGKSRSSGPFIFNIRSGALQKFENMDAALAQFGPRPTLKSANTFYRQLRWRPADLFTMLVTGILAIGIMLFWYRRFIR
jgi:hypothetical protein